MKCCRPALHACSLTTVCLIVTIGLCLSPAFATGLTPFHLTSLPTNFQNLPGPQAVVEMPTELLDPNPDHVQMQFSNPPLEYGSVTIDGASYQTVRLSGEGSSLDPGTPDIPRVTRLIMINSTGNVNVAVLNQSYTIESGIYPAPVQPLAGDNGSPEPVAVAPDLSVYDSDNWYPPEVATISEPATLRDVRFVVLTIYPVQVNPVTQQMRVYDNIQVEIQNVGGIGENEIHIHPTSIAPSFKQLYGVFENFGGSALDALPVFPGSYLVICNNSGTVLTHAQRLVDWRKRKGIDGSILAMNITSASTTAIRDSISARYNASGGQLEYVCMIGDPQGNDPFDFPSNSAQYDNYYGCISGGGGPNPDPVPDVAVGRISATDATQLNHVVTKSINYEAAPSEAPDANWFTRAWCASHTAHIPSNPSTKEYTRQIMLQHGVTTVYWDVYGGGITGAQIETRLSQGISVFNHRMSWISETPYGFSSSLSDNPRLPFVASITCYSGNFTSERSISEEWLIPNGATGGTPKGAIGCVGVATASTHVPFNNIVDAGMMYGLYVLDIPEQGNILISGKLELYKNYWAVGHSGDVQNFSYWTNLMGDPAVCLWHFKPVHPTVIHPANINVGTNNVSITLSDSSAGTPIEGALVCLLKGTETFSRGYTAANGVINLACTAPTTGDMLLTITKNNLKTVVDTIHVVTSAASLSLNGRTVDDDNVGGTVGDNNHALNPGEIIDLTVNLTNSGTSTTISGITGTLSTSSAGVQVTQASSGYPNIAPGANANNTTAFRFSLTSVFNNEPVTFFLNLTSSIGSQTVRLDFTPGSGDVTYMSSTFSGPGGTVDPGESGNLTVTYRNSGSRSLISSNGILRSLDTDVSVSDSVGVFGTVIPSADGNNAGNPFAIDISVGTYNGHRALMQLVITDANGFRDSTSFYLTAGTQASTSPSGPDGYGYYAYDNTETTPPAGASFYEWIEIAPSQGGTGTSLNFNDTVEDADQSTVLNLPFNFVFYGNQFNQITVCTNGWLSMGSTTIDDFRNYRMGTPIGPPNQVAAYWDDLKAWGTSNNVYYKYDAVNHWYIVEWRAQTLWTSVNEFFEIILFDPAFYPSASGNGKIKFQYNTLSLSPNQGSNDNDYSSVGIQNADHSIGLDYYYWNTYTAGSAALLAGRAIMITTDATGQLNPGVTVSAPNGGESWFVGQPYNILWSSTGISGNVDVALNRNYPGGAWEAVVSNTANDGVHLWTVTGNNTTANARIRVVSTIQPTIGDTSNANFTLQIPTVNIVAPNGGEILSSGTQYLINWTSSGLGASTLSLNRNYPGGTWEVLDPNAGTELLWLVTGPPTTNARVRVAGNTVPSAGDTSAVNFTIGIAPAIAHDPHADQAPGAALFTAQITDDVPGFVTKLFYRAVGASNFDSLTFAATANPDEYSATTSSLAVNRYEYYVRSTDTQNLSTFYPSTGTFKFDVGYLGTNWLGCDDGSAETYNWVNGPGFKWAVKFDPGSYPFALSGGRFAVSPLNPTPEHDRVVFTVRSANGPGGLPGTVVFTDTTGSPGNIIGGLPTGAAWADVVTRVAGSSLTLNSAFYLCVENLSPRYFPVAFGRDSSGVRCHTSYYWDECEAAWFNEDDAGNPNSRPGNRMIRAIGFALTPPTIVIYRTTNDVTLRWGATGAPYYKVFAATTPTGPFDTLIGTVTTNTFSDVNAVNLNLKRFYQVVSSDTP